MTLMPVFTEQQTEKLTSLSRQTLGRWRREGIFRPTYEVEPVPGPYRWIYTFADVVTLRVLATLRREHGVPLGELRSTAERLAGLGDDLWRQRLVVLGRQVLIDGLDAEAMTDRAGEGIVVEIAATRAQVDEAAADLRRRDPTTHGQVTRSRFVMHNAWVIAGTRIPTAAIRRFDEDGYDEAEIIGQYPGLVPEDIHAALAHERGLRAVAA